VIGIITCVIGAATTCFIAFTAIDVTISHIERGVYLTASFGSMPKWILLVFVPFAMSMTFIEFIVWIRKHILGLIHPENIDSKSGESEESEVNENANRS